MRKDSREQHLSDYLYVIKHRKGIIATFFFLTVFIVAGVSLIIKPIYRATVTLFVDMERPYVLTTTGSFNLENTNYFAYKEYLQSQKEVIKSRTIAKEIFQEFELDQEQEYIKAKDPIEKFLKNIKVETIRDTRLLLLNFDDEDPERAAQIANHIAEMYVERNLFYITRIEVLNLLKNEYLKLQSKYSEFSKIYKHKHPKMIRLKREMAQISEQIATEMAKSTSLNARNAYPQEFDPEAAGSILPGFKANNISIQDLAEAPIKPVFPKKRLNVLFAIIVGLLGGVGLAFFFEYLDDTARCVEDVERVVEWPFLGHIPEVDRRLRISDTAKDTFVHTHSKDPIAEAYRVIRTSVLFSATEEHPIRNIVVASPGPQEGKTMTLCNLGITMAQNNSRVLLVDADMRKPRMHNIFGSENIEGLSNFLSGNATFSKIIKTTEIENLSFVCGGPYPPNPSELLTSNKMKDFIKKTSKDFDFVLFDTPPVAVVTDAVILSKIVDGVILVVESGKTSKRVLPRIDQKLLEAKARMIGVILNKVATTGRDYQYYYYYYGRTK